MNVVAGVILAGVFLSSCASHPRVISGEQRIGLIQGPVQVQLRKGDEAIPLTSTEQAPLWMVTDAWLQGRYRLERILRLHLDKCWAQGPGANGERPQRPSDVNPALWELTHP